MTENRRSLLVEELGKVPPDEKLSQKITKKSKFARLTANIIAPIGFGFGLTSGLLLKLSTPVASGGLGIATVSSGIFIGLTCGAGALALLVGGFCCYHFYKKSIKESVEQLKRLEKHKAVITVQKEFVRHNRLIAFKNLLALKKIINEEEKGQVKENLENIFLNQHQSLKLKKEKIAFFLDLINKKSREDNPVLDDEQIIDCFKNVDYTPCEESKASIWWSLYTGISAGVSSLSLSYILYATILGTLTFNPFSAPIVIIAATALALALTIGFTYHYLEKEKAVIKTQINHTSQEIEALHDVGDELATKNLANLKYLKDHYHNSDKIAQDYQVDIVNLQTNNQKLQDLYYEENQIKLAHTEKLLTSANLQIEQLKNEKNQLEEKARSAEERAREAEEQVRQLKAQIEKLSKTSSNDEKTVQSASITPIIIPPTSFEESVPRSSSHLGTHSIFASSAASTAVSSSTASISVSNNPPGQST